MDPLPEAGWGRRGSRRQVEVPGLWGQKRRNLGERSRESSERPGGKCWRGRVPTRGWNKIKTASEGPALLFAAPKAVGQRRPSTQPAHLSWGRPSLCFPPATCLPASHPDSPLFSSQKMVATPTRRSWVRTNCSLFPLCSGWPLSLACAIQGADCLAPPALPHPRPGRPHLGGPRTGACPRVFIHSTVFLST